MLNRSPSTLFLGNTDSICIDQPKDDDHCLQKSWRTVWECKHFRTPEADDSNGWRDHCTEYRADLGRCCPVSCGDKDKDENSHGKELGLGLRYTNGRCKNNPSQAYKNDCDRIGTWVLRTQCKKSGI